MVSGAYMSHDTIKIIIIKSRTDIQHPLYLPTETHVPAIYCWVTNHPEIGLLKIMISYYRPIFSG